MSRRLRRISQSAFFIGLLSLVWLLLRTGTKPSRSAYPCQQVAMLNGYMWLHVYLLPWFLPVQRRFSASLNAKKLMVIGLVAVTLGSATYLAYESCSRPGGEAVDLTLSGRVASSQPASDIFVVKGTWGNDGGLAQLLNLMGEHGLLFYKSPLPGRGKGPTGLFGRNDVVIVKVNSQWDERGGTNTDLLKALIQALVDHPDGFTGEVVVADNGQAQYGSAGAGGSLTWARNNAEDRSQSAQKVVDSFSGYYRVSTYLWDRITAKRVDEYAEGDMEDGYVVNATANPRTGLMVSYPKFKTSFGTYVSFKLGVWDPDRRNYDGERLKVINIPVLKSHSIYGVTASVKHYMGVVSDKLTSQLGASSHQAVGTGGMGTEMAETRFPALNILDAIWVNAAPRGGPGTPYDKATRLNIIAASTDPAALDYWAAKHVLLPAARIKGYSGVSSMDPDEAAPGSFGGWLRLSMAEMRQAGYQATVDEANMNVYVTRLQPTRG
ncbi:MAG: DUF362 domain-containing protein [Candidatus Bathyarchaeia archaeon]